MIMLRTLAVASLVFSFTFSGALPSSASPFFVQNRITASSDVVQVRDGVRWRRGWNNGGWNNGYRGHRNYRYNNGWYPAGAAIAGVIIGGAIANSYNNGGYYGNGYYGNGYNSGYYQQPAYYPRANAYRQGYSDGYRAGRNDALGGGIRCTQRLNDLGRC